MKSDELWGSLNYKEVDGIHVKGFDVASYSGGTNTANISYAAKVNGVAGYLAEVTVANLETNDYFQIVVKDTTVTNTPVIYQASGNVTAGSIRHHTPGE